jgi:hypothetical protein
VMKPRTHHGLLLPRGLRRRDGRASIGRWALRRRSDAPRL